jgi:hypothetical protein
LVPAGDVLVHHLQPLDFPPITIRPKSTCRTDSQSETEQLLKIVDDDGIVVNVSAKRTRASGPVLRKGPFKGKRIELASTAGIESLKNIADDFMLDIFGFEPGECLITDLSSLHDFVGVDDLEFVDILARIRNVYRLDVADLPSGNLLEISGRHSGGSSSTSRADLQPERAANFWISKANSSSKIATKPSQSGFRGDQTPSDDTA